VAGSQLLEDGANVVGALAQMGEGQWLVEGKGAVQIEPPARLGTRHLQPAAGFAPVGEPDGRSLGDATGGARPGDDRALVQAVVKDDVAGLDPVGFANSCGGLVFVDEAAEQVAALHAPGRATLCDLPGPVRLTPPSGDVRPSSAPWGRSRTSTD